MLTQKYLKECLNYNPETGVFIWLKRPERHFTKSCQAGTFNNQFAGLECGKIGKRSETIKYRIITINNKSYSAHALAILYCYGYMPEVVDHINGDGLDNRLVNLRSVTRSENSRNCKLRKDNKSGVPGVSLIASAGRWRVRISTSKGHESIGCYDDYFDAVCARKSAENKNGYTHRHGKPVNKTNCRG